MIKSNSINKPQGLPHVSKTSAVFAVIAMALSHYSWAEEPTQLREKSPHYGEDGWDVSLGLAAVAFDAPFYLGEADSGTEIVPLLDVTYQKGRFYFTANDPDGLILAYTLMKGDTPGGQWVLDAGFAPGITGGDFSDSEDLKHLEDRDIDGLLGLRYSRYGMHNRWTFSVGQDVLGAHDGMAASANYAHEWQLKNWLLTGSAGVSYLSDKMAHHIAGVNADEATSAIPAYQAEAAYSAYLGLKAEYPVSEHWVFTGSTGVGNVSSSIQDSPMTYGDSNMGTHFLAGMKYQF